MRSEFSCRLWQLRNKDVHGEAPCPQAKTRPKPAWLTGPGMAGSAAAPFPMFLHGQPSPAALPSSGGTLPPHPQAQLPLRARLLHWAPATLPSAASGSARLLQNTLFTLSAMYFGGWFSSRACTYAPLPSLVCSRRAGTHFTLIFHF